jgi:hypothetical protein
VGQQWCDVSVFSRVSRDYCAKTNSVCSWIQKNYVRPLYNVTPHLYMWPRSDTWGMFILWGDKFCEVTVKQASLQLAHRMQSPHRILEREKKFLGGYVTLYILGTPLQPLHTPHHTNLYHSYTVDSHYPPIILLPFIDNELTALSIRGLCHHYL